MSFGLQKVAKSLREDKNQTAPTYSAKKMIIADLAKKANMSVENWGNVHAAMKTFFVGHKLSHKLTH